MRTSCFGTDVALQIKLTKLPLIHCFVLEINEKLVVQSSTQTLFAMPQQCLEQQSLFNNCQDMFCINFSNDRKIRDPIICRESLESVHKNHNNARDNGAYSLIARTRVSTGYNNF